MTQEEAIIEIKKCKDSPYYFATKYLTIKNKEGESIPYTTAWTEDEFNSIINNCLNSKV